jgi:hypothetical protein
MTNITLELEGVGCWPDLAGVPHGQIRHAQLTSVALLPDAAVVDTLTGEEKTAPTVTLRIELDNGVIALAQVKVDMMEMILRGVRGRLDLLAELRAKGGAPS